MEKLSTCTTTYRNQFLPHPADKFTKKAPHTAQLDPTLIPGYFANNITVKNTPEETRTWEKPKINQEPEEYNEYVKKLQQNKPDFYKKYFTNPDVNVDLAESIVKEPKKTTYQHVFSPGIFVSLKEGQRWRQSTLDTSKLKHYESTYNTYFSRVAEFDSMAPNTVDAEEQHLNDLLKPYKKGMKAPKTTYYTNVCLPVISQMDLLLRQGKIKEPPLDRYTLRRV